METTCSYSAGVSPCFLTNSGVMLGSVIELECKYQNFKIQWQHGAFVEVKQANPNLQPQRLPRGRTIQSRLLPRSWRGAAFGPRSHCVTDGRKGRGTGRRGGEDLPRALERGVDVGADVFLAETGQEPCALHGEKRLGMRTAEDEMLAL